MHFEGTALVLLNDGVIKFDGGAIFGQVPKTSWEQRAQPDRRNRVSLGLNCLLIQNGEPLAYVRDQLGHSSIKMTVDGYRCGHQGAGQH